MCGCVNGCSYLCKYGVKITKYELKARIKQYNKIMKGFQNVK